MRDNQTSTKQKILNASEKEFLEKGFEGASLRNIVKSAGVTTGAFYGYFETKEAIFSALVKECADIVMEKFIKMQEDFEGQSNEQQIKNMGNCSFLYLEWLIEYIYENYSTFKLLICCSQGTEYGDYVHKMVEIEVEQTMKFMGKFEQSGYKTPPVDRQLCHIISSGMFGGIFEILVHDMPKEKAVMYVQQLCKFHTAGWTEIMGL